MILTQPLVGFPENHGKSGPPRFGKERGSQQSVNMLPTAWICTKLALKSTMQNHWAARFGTTHSNLSISASLHWANFCSNWISWLSFPRDPLLENQERNQGNPLRVARTRNPSIQRAKEEERGHLMPTWEETLSHTKKNEIRSFISPLGRRNVTISLPWVWRMVFKRIFRNLTFWNENMLPRADKSKESSGPGDNTITWTASP